MIKTNTTRKQAFLYTRVSTEEQATKGGSLKTQKDTLQQYCMLQNIEIIKIFTEDHSAKTFNRPEWKKLMFELESSKTRPDLVLITRWDRFSRNTGDAYYVIKKLKKLGVEPQAVEQPLDLSIPENKMMFAYYLAIPEVENDRRGLNTKIGMLRAKERGRWIGRAPIGYINHCMADGMKIIIPKEPEASIIRASFHQLANLRCNITDAHSMSVKEGMVNCRSNFWKMLQNPVYTGSLKVTDTLNSSSHTVLGLHKAIVSIPTFNRVQELFFKRKRPANTNNRNIRNLKFPLKGFICCPRCGKSLMTSASTGRSQVYRYYHCYSNCGYRIRSEIVYERFIVQIKALKPIPEYFERYKTHIQFNYSTYNKELYIKRMREIKSIEIFTDRIHKAKDLLLDSRLEFHDYMDIKTDLEAKIKILSYSLESNAKKQIALADKVEEAATLFADLDKFLCMLELRNRNAFFTAILKPNHNWESGNTDEIFKKTFRIVFGLERPVEICTKTDEDITGFLKEMANIELLVSY